MRKYHVHITETLHTIVAIEANSSDEALEKAKDMYRNEEIVLTSENYVGTDYVVAEDDNLCQRKYTE